MDTKMNLDLSPIIRELINQKASIWALANQLLPNDKWEKFIKDYEERSLLAWKDFLDAWPDIMTNKDIFLAEVDKKLSELKK